MREKIDCFLPQGDAKVMEEMAVQLRNSKAVQNVIMMETGLMSSNALMQVAENAKADYVLLLTKPVKVTLGSAMPLQRYICRTAWPTASSMSRTGLWAW